TVFFIYINIIYILFPFLISKSFLVLWGGDLYFYFNRTKNLKNRVIESLRKIVLSKWINIITYINEDFNNFRKWYNLNAVQYVCIMYPSNVFSIEKSDFKYNNLNCDKVNIMIGNSAIPENRHELALKVINNSLFVNATIYCPLSYGDHQYANKISQLGISYFGERFISLFDYMDKEMYLIFLSKMDIVLMLQERQAGMGNIIQLLGLGKKIYFISSAPHYVFLRDLGFVVFDFADFKNEKLSFEDVENNSKLVEKYFAYNDLVYQWNKIFEYENKHSD
uniref:TDP-N-acetylfucosamine:lipid II N-acetylfucosaminyltransferase n=2 Tax=Flavobacteriaceae TaxID=49546 RepID=UPI00404AEEC0